MNKIYLVILASLLFCKDTFYNKCDSLCTFFSQCVKQNFSINESKFLKEAYPFCVNACMTYYQELSECYRIDQDNSCEKLSQCLFPIIINE